mmetsp:Transcript_53036/g.119501  ORF Transcript_53036/g.119501 Transcript_53036/m.119501 type:complete len:219 (+) Transcript_53036:227-883(+)
MVDRLVRLEPAVRVPPLQDLACDPFLHDAVARQVGPAGPALPRPSLGPAPASALAATAAAGTAVLALAPLALAAGATAPIVALRPCGLLAELGVRRDLLQRKHRGALLGLLLGGEDLPGPGAVLPLSRKCCEPHSRLVASDNLAGLIHRLTLLEESLGDPHAEGVELGLRRDGRIVTLLSRLCLLVRGAAASSSLGRWRRGRQYRLLRRVSREGLLRG